MNNQPVIACQGLSKTFSEGEISADVLVGVSMEIAPRDRIAIVGASGAGKSTLLHLLGGLDEPSGGSVQVEGQDLGKLPETDRCQLRNRVMGFVYQFHHLLAEFTALENVAMPLLIRGVPADEAEKAAREIIERVELGHRALHRPGELSGGERQRVAVARALVTRPRCVLADEPTGNLDHKTAKRVFDLIMEINAELETSLLIVTHDHDLASRMDRVMLLEDGLLQDA